MELAILPDDGDVLRLQAGGRITQEFVSVFPDPMRNLIGEDGFQQRAVLSLSGVDYIDSSGIGWLVARHKEFRKCGGKLVVHSVEPEVFQILKMMRFHTVLTLAKDERGALAAAKRK